MSDSELIIRLLKAAEKRMRSIRMLHEVASGLAFALSERCPARARQRLDSASPRHAAGVGRARKMMRLSRRSFASAIAIRSTDRRLRVKTERAQSIRQVVSKRRGEI